MLPVADMNLQTFLEKADLDDTSRSFLRPFFGCLTSALSYLHDNRIRHKDIKPSNVLIKHDQVYLTDFGTSLDWSGCDNSTTETALPTTPRYCAPEVMAFVERNTSSDIWSLGCVFLEMWTVLKRHTLDGLKTHMSAHGTHVKEYHHNLEAVASWVQMLENATGPSCDMAPSKGIQNMLQHQPRSRWNCHILANHIQEASSDPSSEYAFKGLCCLELDDDTTDGTGSSEGFDEYSESEDVTQSPPSLERSGSEKTVGLTASDISRSESVARTKSPDTAALVSPAQPDVPVPRIVVNDCHVPPGAFVEDESESLSREIYEPSVSTKVSEDVNTDHDDTISFVRVSEPSGREEKNEAPPRVVRNFDFLNADDIFRVFIRNSGGDEHFDSSGFGMSGLRSGAGGERGCDEGSGKDTHQTPKREKMDRTSPRASSTSSLPYSAAAPKSMDKYPHSPAVPATRCRLCTSPLSVATDAVRLSCYHWIHKSCYAQGYARSSTSCPTCNSADTKPASQANRYHSESDPSVQKRDQHNRDRDNPRSVRFDSSVRILPPVRTPRLAEPDTEETRMRKERITRFPVMPVSPLGPKHDPLPRSASPGKSILKNSPSISRRGESLAALTGRLSIQSAPVQPTSGSDPNLASQEHRAPVEGRSKKRKPKDEYTDTKPNSANDRSGSVASRPLLDVNRLTGLLQFLESGYSSDESHQEAKSNKRAEARNRPTVSTYRYPPPRSTSAEPWVFVEPATSGQSRRSGPTYRTSQSRPITPPRPTSAEPQANVVLITNGRSQQKPGYPVYHPVKREPPSRRQRDPAKKTRSDLKFANVDSEPLSNEMARYAAAYDRRTEAEARRGAEERRTYGDNRDATAIPAGPHHVQREETQSGDDSDDSMVAHPGGNRTPNIRSSPTREATIIPGYPSRRYGPEDVRWGSRSNSGDGGHNGKPTLPRTATYVY